MKGLLTAFTILSFVAASSLPMIALAQETNHDQPMSDHSATDTDHGAAAPDHAANPAPAHHATTHRTTHHVTHRKRTVHHKTHRKHTVKHHKTNPPPKQG